MSIQSKASGPKKKIYAAIEKARNNLASNALMGVVDKNFDEHTKTRLHSTKEHEITRKQNKDAHQATLEAIMDLKKELAEIRSVVAPKAPETFPIAQQITHHESARRAP